MKIINATLKISAGLASQFPDDTLPQIVLSGRSNVGKSSLVNTLLGRKSLARVSSAPGKTVTINFYEVDGRFYLVDLPGYGFAKRNFEEKAKWSALTDGFFTGNSNTDKIALVIQLIDCKAGPTQDDRTMLDYLNRSGIPYAVAATKTDKLNRTDRERCLAAIAESPFILPGTPIVPFSSLKKEGKEELLKIIFQHLK